METYKELKNSQVYELRPNAYAYGFSVGILYLDSEIIKIKGDLNNVSTYDFNALMVKVDGVSPSDLKNPSSQTISKVVDLAKRMEQQGIKSLSYSNGLFSICHEDLTKAVSIPVVNVLEMIPLIHDYFLGGVKKLGILTTDSSLLNESFLRGRGFTKGRNIEVFGVQEVNGFSEQLQGNNEELDSALLNESISEYARSISEKDQNIKAFLVESNILTPYSESIRIATGLPTYDLRNALNFVHLATHQKEYQGDY